MKGSLLKYAAPDAVWLGVQVSTYDGGSFPGASLATLKVKGVAARTNSKVLSGLGAVVPVVSLTCRLTSDLVSVRSVGSSEVPPLAETVCEE